MDNITKLNLLFDCYGSLLTENQRNVFKMHYFNDLSLGEIAEITGITRQGVYDALRRSQEMLINFEENLGMVKRYLKQEKEIKHILEVLKEIEPGVDSAFKEKYEDVCNCVYSLLQEGGE
ncbi:YlxM family DNA-binding protein [Tepidanaerobacter sp. EBM-49]|uniref:YlxM family DNA-binding protein n=1 Tax=Tepidanaerobacter sp. EBM-49 TaxID=1918504 RepID=UPI000AFFF006|nr:YlxM family DNA-binding protein [Tepidanaerobacter sp. EBM-49]